MSSGGDNRARHLALYGTMCRIRAFEETALAAHKAGEIPGPLHVSIGQEGVAAGICMNLRRDDRITSNHRGHGHALAKGAGVAGMMEELFGRAGGHCRGKGGSMHIADFSVGMLGANGVVAGGIPIAVGAAQGIKLLGGSSIVACFFGDGAINRGPFLEGLNWAVLYRLPVLFVCEDNGVAAFTATATVTAGPGVAARSEALGVPCTSVDGNDAAAVDATAARLVAEIRAGAGRAQQSVTIGCLPTIAVHHVPRLLRDFSALHPGVTVKVFDNSASEIAERVARGEAELGITIVSANRWDLDIVPLLTEAFVLACPAAHPFADRPHLSWGDLEGQPLVRVAPHTGNRALLDEALGARRDAMDWRYEVQHLATAISMVEAGIALAVVPRLAVDAAGTVGVVAVPLRDPAVVRRLGVVSRRGVPLSPAAEALLALLRQRFRAARGGGGGQMRETA